MQRIQLNHLDLKCNLIFEYVHATGLYTFNIVTNRLNVNMSDSYYFSSENYSPCFLLLLQLLLLYQTYLLHSISHNINTSLLFMNGNFKSNKIKALQLIN